jgi:cytochrome c
MLLLQFDLHQYAIRIKEYFEHLHQPKEINLKARYIVAITAAICISSSAFAASEGEALFNSSGCTSCHSVDKKVVGPALKDVAAKYAGDKKAQAMLEKKVRSGGSGSFQNMMMPMPATPASVSDANIKSMVTWILGLK